MFEIKISVPVRWHAWCGDRITADSTALRIAVVSDRYWFPTGKKDEYLTEAYIETLKKEGQLYDLPSNWGQEISMKNLPFHETIFVEMLPEGHPWKTNKKHVRAVARLRELCRLNPGHWFLPVRMEG